MNPDLDPALDDCLAMLHTGASVDECLVVYPAQAAALRPLLELASAVHGLPAPQARPAAVQTNRARMMAAVAARQPSVNRAAVLPVSGSLLARYTGRIKALLPGKSTGQREGKNMVFVLRFATAAITAVMAFTTVSAGGAALASANSLPGDALYPVKRTVEDVQLFFTLGETAQEQFRLELEIRRRNEVQAVVLERRQVEVQFWGPLTAFTANQWVVDGLAVLVDGQTQIIGEPVEGATVHVLAVTQADGSILAQQLMVRPESPGRHGPGASATPPGTGVPQRTPQGTGTTTCTPQRTPNPTGTPQSGPGTPQGGPGTPQSGPGTPQSGPGTPQPSGAPHMGTPGPGSGH